MIKLIFMRHGEAEPPGRDDLNRSLTARGQQKVRAVAAGLQRVDFVPDMILSSHANRTRETTLLAAEVLQVPSHTLNFCKPLYLADFGTLLEELSEIDGQGKTILLVGHNPGWSDIVSSLTNQALSLSPGDACCCVFDGSEPLYLALTSVGQWQLRAHITG